MLTDETNDLTPAMRRMLTEFGDDVGRLDARIAQVGREIEALADRDDRARRLMTISTGRRLRHQVGAAQDPSQPSQGTTFGRKK